MCQRLLRIGEAMKGVVMSRLRTAKLTTDTFAVWRAEVNEMLGNNPKQHLGFVGGKDPYHELKMRATHENRVFNLIWEIEWNKSKNEFHLLEFLIREENPKLATNES